MLTAGVWLSHAGPGHLGDMKSLVILVLLSVAFAIALTSYTHERLMRRTTIPATASVASPVSLASAAQQPSH